MTIRQLIEALSRFDPDLTVAVDGYEGGVTDQIRITEKPVALNVNGPNVWYYGSHEVDEHGIESDHEHVQMVILQH